MPIEPFLLRDYIWSPDTVEKMKFFIKDFFSKCDQIRHFLNY